MCLVINILFSVLATTIKGAPDGVGTLYEGDCGKVHNIDTWLHVALNGLATALIGASNYNMQCLSAPSRSEVDKAHLDGTSLDIGVPSIRNLRHISGRRMAVWMVLCISTVPLHLLWNSAIFSTFQDNNYLLVGVSTDALHDANLECPSLYKSLADEYHNVGSYANVACALYDSIRDSSTASVQMHRIEPEECIERYNKTMQAEWSNLVVVFDASTSFTCSSCYNNTGLPNVTTFFESFIADSSPFSKRTTLSDCAIDSHAKSAGYWVSDFNSICSPTDRSAKLFSGEYSIAYRMEYCLASRAPQVCKLQFSLWIMIVVIFCNSAKLLAMIGTLTLIKEDHFITVGDAVSSFLVILDSNTVGSSSKAISQLWGTYSQPYTAPSTTSRSARMSVTTDAGERTTWLQAVPKGRLSSIIIL